MKTRKVKLHLNKETVVNLNHDELEKLKAGIVPITTTRPYTDTWLECCGPVWVTYPTMTLCGDLQCP
jgi:hypothetical protein